MINTKPVVDMLGRKVVVPVMPSRIVSLVPSQTELLYYFGLNQEVVGQTIFCIHPNEMHQKKERIGGTKKLNIEKIRSLNPDLIIANKEENTKEQIEELAKDFPVWISDVYNLQTALEMIFGIGAMLKKRKEAAKLSALIASNFKQLIKLEKPLNMAYLIWYNPFMAAGKDTFINSILTLAGFNNCFQNHESRYPEIQLNELKKADIVFLSSEPFPFKQKHIDEIQAINANAKIMLVDGELFSWYGNRLINTPNYFNQLIKELA